MLKDSSSVDTNAIDIGSAPNTSNSTTCPTNEELAHFENEVTKNGLLLTYAGILVSWRIMPLCLLGLLPKGTR